jgi:antitoxin PrlF
MPVSTLTSKGQTTIPVSVRRHLRLRPGDRIDFVVEADGRVIVRPASLDLLELAGILKRPRKSAVTLEEMDEVIRARAAGTD